MNSLYDIAVIGTGPAGAFLVKHLDSKFKVIVIDRKSNKDFEGFCKPCGGLLAPDAQKSLSRFNMPLPKDILVSPQIFSVRTIDVKSKLVRYYQRHYINLDRHKFDQWLGSQIPKHVKVHNNATCTDIKKVDDVYEITFYEHGKYKKIRSTYLVGADGAASIVRRKLFKDIYIQKYIAIQQWFQDTHETPFYSCIFDSDTTNSYAWGLSKDGSFIFGGAFKIKNGRSNFEALKTKLKHYGFRLGKPEKTEACLVLLPRHLKNFCTGKDRAFLCGEAAGFISPSSLEGISYAIDSAYMLAQCLNKGGTEINKKYNKATRNIRLKLLLKNLKRPFMYNTFIRKIIMKSGLSSINLVTDKPGANRKNT